MLRLCLLLAAASMLVGRAHECIHDQLDLQEPSMQDQTYGDHPFARRLATETYNMAVWNPIRITLYTDYLTDPTKNCLHVGDSVTVGGVTFSCTEDNLLTEEKKTFLTTQLLPAATDFFKSALRVHPVTGNLTSSSLCSSYITVPPVAQSVSDTDFLLIVTAGPTSGNTLAWALTCQVDQYGRPIVGYANLGPNRMDLASDYFSEQVGTLLHETTHALGFSASMFAKYRDTNGAVYGINNVRQTTTERGGTVNKIITPKVVQFVKDHFNCPVWANGAGGELEDDGSGGTAGSHWEKRVFRNEYMTGSSDPSPVFSGLTLSLFEDMGFYKANYEVAQTLKWGKNLGCTFPQAKCNEWAFGLPYFCSDSTQRACNFDYTAKGYCNLATYSQPLASNEQYFSDPTKGGWDSFADYCPFMQRSTVCATLSNENGNSVIYGEKFGASSRCFKSSLLKNSYTATGDTLIRCLQTTCGSDGSLSVTISTGDTKVCPTAGGTITFTGYKGNVTCPPATAICTATSVSCPNSCSNHGSCSNGVCSCVSGYTGTDCSQLVAYPCGNPVCTNHGTCSAQGACVCDAGWNGTSCSIATASSANVTGIAYTIGSPVTFSLAANKWAYYVTDTTPGQNITINVTSSTTNVSIAVNNRPSQVSLVISADVLPGLGVNQYSWKSLGSASSKNTVVKIMSTDWYLSFGTQLLIGIFSPTAASIKLDVTMAKLCAAGCNGHGNCTNGVCSCQTGYSGLACEHTNCPGTPECTNHGSCVAGVCSCSTGWSGSDCSVMTVTSKTLSAGQSLQSSVAVAEWEYIQFTCGKAATATILLNKIDTDGSDPYLFVSATTQKPTERVFDAADTASWQNNLRNARAQVIVGTAGGFIGVYNTKSFALSTLVYNVSLTCTLTDSTGTEQVCCSSIRNNCTSDCSGFGSCGLNSLQKPICTCQSNRMGPDCGTTLSPLSIGTVNTVSVELGSWVYFNLSLSQTAVTNKHIVKVNVTSSQTLLVLVKANGLPSLNSYEYSSQSSWFTRSNISIVDIPLVDSTVNRLYIAIYNHKYYSTSGLSATVSITSRLPGSQSPDLFADPTVGYPTVSSSASDAVASDIGSNTKVNSKTQGASSYDMWTFTPPVENLQTKFVLTGCISCSIFASVDGFPKTVFDFAYSDNMQTTGGNASVVIDQTSQDPVYLAVYSSSSSGESYSLMSENTYYDGLSNGVTSPAIVAGIVGGIIGAIALIGVFIVIYKYKPRRRPAGRLGGPREGEGVNVPLTGLIPPAPGGMHQGTMTPAFASGWRSAVDVMSGRVYYYNIQDGQVSWDSPAGW